MAASKKEKEESNAGLFVALGVAGAVLAIALAVVGLRKPPPPLPPPPKPHPGGNVSTVRATLHNSENFFRAVVEEDARKYSLPPVDLADLATPLKHAVELELPRTLSAGQSFDTPHLAIKLEVAKEWAGAGGRGFRADHLVLSIANRTGTPIAYRVDTAVGDPSRCRGKGAIAQNALALAGNETVRRTECTFHRGDRVTVNRVEIVELTALGLHYVNRLLPDQLNLDPRTSDGHEIIQKVKPCQFVPSRDIAAGGAGWADVIDFYARHNCDEYTAYGSYRLRTEPVSLPAVEHPDPPPDAKLPGTD